MTKQWAKWKNKTKKHLNYSTIVDVFSHKLPHPYIVTSFPPPATSLPLNIVYLVTIETTVSVINMRWNIKHEKIICEHLVSIKLQFYKIMQKIENII